MQKHMQNLLQQRNRISYSYSYSLCGLLRNKRIRETQNSVMEQ